MRDAPHLRVDEAPLTAEEAAEPVGLDALLEATFVDPPLGYPEETERSVPNPYFNLRRSMLARNS